MSKYELENGYIIEAETGEEVLCINDINENNKEIVKQIIIELLQEIAECKLN